MEVLGTTDAGEGKNNMVDFPALSTFHLSSSTLRRSDN
jgi:hypothetical protein